ncbi:nucleotide-binding universal stress UspA family protein [Salsuginibacillus halophilus]|uniref:Universal stress protein n=2 Tax=Salsuginibacillus halophilus TaxID=517424 RepID=A0A2P8HEH2_9BACI|nr:nucleotide-binding universal stress UspA family protein [Salsuginibacillus halophilus]
MSKYNTVLVGMDGSEEAKTAFQTACESAKNHEAGLVIAHVIDTRTFATIEQYDRTIVSRAETQAKDMLADYKQQAEEYGVSEVQTVIEFGSPKAKIPKDLAKSYNVDLIVTGATGLNKVERILMGSVSEAITRHAQCDVLIVRS